MGKEIFHITKSKTRVAMLELFFNDPEKEYYLRQIEKLSGYSVGNIRREMAALESGGLFTHRMLGRIKLYKLNLDYPLYMEIKGVIRKTVSIEGALRSIAAKHKQIQFAFIYGSFAKGQERGLSDIDIVIIAEAGLKDIKSDLYNYQSAVGREINSIIYTEGEFLKKLKDKNHFISSIIKEPKIFLKGTEDEFRGFIQVRKTKKT
ncbi:MAG: nucleotidyltransferase domain-containing protein [Candidatus Omnitrophota bacterium]